MSSEMVVIPTTKIEIQIPARYPDLIREIQEAVGEVVDISEYVCAWVVSCIEGDVSRIYDKNPERGLALIRKFNLEEHFTHILS